ncbi:MAG: DUF1460 domain-containing protein [Prevotella sp.]|nr:DUF1460 domain-containing protein [Prevotella sp.]
MRKIIVSAIMLMAVTAAHTWAAGPQYTRQDSLKAVQLMKNAASQPSGTNLIIYIAEQMKGIPYVAHTLEPNNNERLIINLRQLDCTTFVEQVSALYLCVKEHKTTFADYCKMLQKLRYEGGAEPHYTKRLHYYSSWIEDKKSMDICKEIQSPNPPFTKVQRLSLNWMTTHVNDYRMLKNNPSWVPQIRKMEQKMEGRQYRYIPKEQIKNTRLLRNTIKDGDIIAIITNKKGLDTQHLGFALWHKDGLHLLNASSIHKKVIDEPMTLRTYLYKHPSMPGVRIIRLTK